MFEGVGQRTEAAAFLLLPHQLLQRRRDYALFLRGLRNFDRDQLGERLVVAPATPLAVELERHVLALDAEREAAAAGFALDERGDVAQPLVDRDGREHVAVVL